MPEITIEQLRKLRQRAEEMLRNIYGDLHPFLHKEEPLTFRRTPNASSNKGDINVTTSCSCLMALALTGELSAFSKNASKDPLVAFGKMIEAPWLSSGITENNAFTTTLMLRTLGYLGEQNVLTAADVLSFRKEWELNLGIKKSHIKQLAKKLKQHKDVASRFLWKSLSDKTRDKLSLWKTNEPVEKLATSISLELRRIIQSGPIYESARFPAAKSATIDRIKKSKTANQLAAANRWLLIDTYGSVFLKPKKIPFSQIAAEMASDLSNFKINEYPASAAIVYWFVDGVDRAKIGTIGSESWRSLCKWSTDQFNHERSLVGAQHEAMMDPVAMAMCACLCSRLRAISNNPKTARVLGTSKDHLEILPSQQELENSILELFKRQTNGIWPKYFPMFHYQDAGSNFCFTFELLESILVEFGGKKSDLLDNSAFVKGLEDAVTWCDENRLDYLSDQISYCGWNSGGYIETLRKDQPESWATAVVYMFLWELKHVLSLRIQDRLLREYNAQAVEKGLGLSDLLDIEILEHGSKSLRNILRDEIIEKYKNENQLTLRRTSSKAVKSALLFGPPGTSKTQITKAVAKELSGWPFIQIDPSHFLKQGLEHIYIQADKIFKDLMDLAGVIVFFDEMDALVQTRDASVSLDTAGQFLTTFMLPKLTELHDGGRLVFFMATNYQEKFDAAIKRAGRFDLLLCMGPPTLNVKLRHLAAFLGTSYTAKQNRRAAKLIRGFVRHKPDVKLQLELYTFGEFKTFLKTLVVDNDLVGTLEGMTGVDFAEQVQIDSQSVGLKLGDLEPLLEIDDIDKYYKKKKCRLSSLIDLELKRNQLRKKKIEMTPIIRYFLDRRESKQQS